MRPLPAAPTEDVDPGAPDSPREGIALRMERAKRIGGLTLIALVVVSLWGQWSFVAIWAAVAAVGLPLNAWIVRGLRRRLGLNRSDVLRSVSNAALAAVAAHLTHWPLPVWLWLPFVATALDKINVPTALTAILSSCLILSAVGLSDGVPFIYPVSFSVFAVACWSLCWLRFRSIESMLLAADAQRRELERAHAETREASERLRGGEANLQSLIESTSDFVYSLDPQLRLQAMNTALRDAFEQVNGVSLALGDRLSGGDPVDRRFFDQLAERALRGERISTERTTVRAGNRKHYDVSVNPISGGALGVTFFVRDVTARRKQEEKLQAINKQMIDLSRQAGMAEVATGILHNVGNILNSVNVSAQALRDQLPRSRFDGLARAVTLIEEHADALGEFLTQDPKGRQLPRYLRGLCAHFEAELSAELDELGQLIKNIEHIKSIVALQQNHAKTMGMVETLPVSEVLDDALRLSAPALERNHVEVVAPHDPLEVTIERHKLLQIVVNLLSNANHSLAASARADPRLEIRVACPESGRFQLQVSENGIGISADNLPRLFQQGFTTKSDGHGFGLHMCSLTAKAMGGTLSARSDGPGTGATFTLDLPVNAQRNLNDDSQRGLESLLSGPLEDAGAAAA